MSGPQDRMGGALAAWGRPLVIAHRGASGYLPEHTLEAYALAYGQGADFLEPDVVLTRDGVAICLHDVVLERVTDVARRFPGRERDDGRFYAIDFTLDEVRELTATGGARHGLRGCGLPTLAEMIALTQHLNERSGRDVGIAPELKKPTFHRENGQSVEDVFARVLREADYVGPSARCIVQCFEHDALVRLRVDHDVDVPRLACIGREAPDESELIALTEVAEAIGPSKDAIAASSGALVAAAHDLGLGVIPYTFDDDEAETRRFFGEYGVDALFTDYPDVALRARRSIDRR
ncbi:MAG: glycerophosphodiester phosphodiesterase family protein [Planctomycetota bacterium]